MESKFVELPIKVLAEISKRALESNFDYESPYDDYLENLELIDIASSWAAPGSAEALDLEFLAKFIELNFSILESWMEGNKKFNEISRQFIIPRPKEYLVEYSSKGRGYITQNYSTDWTSYDENWVSPSMSETSSAGEWSYYDGDYIGQEVDDFEEDDLDIDSIEEKPKSKNESIISRLVLENTTDVLDNLDRETLIKLRNLITQKLSS